MNPQFSLAILLLLVMMAIYVWDAYALAIGSNSQTVSQILREWSLAQPILPLAVGLLIGHLFW